MITDSIVSTVPRRLEYIRDVLNSIHSPSLEIFSCDRFTTAINEQMTFLFDCPLPRMLRYTTLSSDLKVVSYGPPTPDRGERIAKILSMDVNYLSNLPVEWDEVNLKTDIPWSEVYYSDNLAALGIYFSRLDLNNIPRSARISIQERLLIQIAKVRPKIYQTMPNPYGKLPAPTITFIRSDFLKILVGPHK